MDSESRPTPMGPPPTSHFHVLSDTPSGLQPVNPPKTPQPSAAKTLLDMDRKLDSTAKKTDSDPGSNFGLKLDQWVGFYWLCQSLSILFVRKYNCDIGYGTFLFFQLTCEL